MPLIMSLKEGDDFYVDDTQFLVEHVAPGAASFRVKAVSTGKVFTVTDSRGEEVLEDVFLAAGRPEHPRTARVAVDAPREKIIVRGDKYRNPPKHLLERARSGSN